MPKTVPSWRMSIRSNQELASTLAVFTECFATSRLWKNALPLRHRKTVSGASYAFGYYVITDQKRIRA